MAKKKDEDLSDLTPEQLIDRAVGEIRNRWGVDCVYVPGEQKKIEKPILGTGIPQLDAIVGNGGIVRGSILEVYGENGSGKTSLCLQIVAQAQKEGLKVLFIDQEQVLNAKYAESIGVKIDDWYIAQPASMEEAFSILESFAKTGQFGLIIVDSLASLVPQAELDKTVEEQTMGIQPKLMSTFLRRINPVLSKTDTTVIFTNQLREKIGGYGNPSTTPGGKAIKFYASYRLEVKIIDSIKGPGGVRVGNVLQVTAVKNKWEKPYAYDEITLMFGEGVDKILGYIDIAEAYGLLVKKGAWYTASPEFGFSFDETQFQGKAKLKAFFEENPAALNEVIDAVTLMGG